MKHNWYLVFAVISIFFAQLSPWFIVAAFVLALIWSNKEEEKEWEKFEKGIDN